MEIVDNLLRTELETAQSLPLTKEQSKFIARFRLDTPFVWYPIQNGGYFSFNLPTKLWNKLHNITHRTSSITGRIYE